MSQQKPTVGRIVHFNDVGGPYAAIVTKINEDGSLELATFGANSMYFQHNVTEDRPYNDDEGSASGRAPGTWSWPPRS
jgi:hypothetical protein